MHIHTHTHKYTYMHTSRSHTHTHTHTQVGDIGLMGAPAKKDGKAAEGFKIMLGGKIGENPELAKDFEKVQSYVGNSS